MPNLSAFASALQAWFQAHPQVSLRQLATEHGISNLSQYRNGDRDITLDALKKLLPAIETASSRKHAITLLIAYLTDETPAEYAAHIQIKATDTSGREDKGDMYTELSHLWEDSARKDPKFHAAWAGLNNYINHPSALTSKAVKEPEEIAKEIDSMVHMHPTSLGKIPIFSGFNQPTPIAAEEAPTKEMEAAIQRAKDQLAEAGKNLTEKPDDSQLAS